MKPYKSEILITPGVEADQFNARINNNLSHAHPSWKPLYDGTIPQIAEKLFNPAATKRVKQIRVIITYNPITKENP